MNSQYLNPQLKFRVYDKKNQCLCEDAPLFVSKEGELLRRKVTSVRDDFNTFRFERLSFEHFEVHRCTGLFDKNQKEIFEQDCLWSTQKKQFFHVEPKSEYIILKSIEDDSEVHLTTDLCKNLIVVGMIYENKSDLEKKLMALQQP